MTETTRGDRIEAALTAVERAGKASRQPRFKGEQGAFFNSVWRWVKAANLEAPLYGSIERNAWLSRFWQREPHLAGVLNSVVAIDKNRSWYLTGGRNQVRRFTDILHNYEAGAGWRYGFGLGAQSYYTTDLGAVVELGREGRSGPLRALYHVDPTRCELTGNPATPLRYRPLQGKDQSWSADDFFRVVSMPSTDESLRGLGFCAVSRALELAKLLVAVYQHDQEQLGARAPRGLLLLQNISQEQWVTAMSARDAQLDGMERRYFDLVAVLAGEGIEQIDAKLVALSQLPASFDRKTVTDLLMYGYALVFGYDPREFWPVSGGQLGSGTETEVMHRKGGAKGGLDYVLAYQERLQQELPPTLHFEFEQRDAEGEQRDAEVALAQVQVAKALYETGLKEGVPLVSREEARSLLANMGVLPPEWTEAEEEALATDTEAARLKRLCERVLELDPIHRSVERFPDEPIVRYAWPAGRTTVLWERGADALARRSFQVAQPQEVAPLPRRPTTRATHGRAVSYEDDYPDGQLCPYKDCAHDLALPEAGWYECGNCGREFWCRVSDSDYEDYVCYRADETPKDAEARPSGVPVAEDLGASWATPEGA